MRNLFCYFEVLQSASTVVVWSSYWFIVIDWDVSMPPGVRTLFNFIPFHQTHQRLLTQHQNFGFPTNLDFQEFEAAESPDNSGSNLTQTERVSARANPFRSIRHVNSTLLAQSPPPPPAPSPPSPPSPPSGLFCWYSRWKWKVLQLHLCLEEVERLTKSRPTHLEFSNSRERRGCPAVFRSSQGRWFQVGGWDSEIHSSSPRLLGAATGFTVHSHKKYSKGSRWFRPDPSHLSLSLSFSLLPPPRRTRWCIWQLSLRRALAWHQLWAPRRSRVSGN